MVMRMLRVMRRARQRRKPRPKSFNLLFSEVEFLWRKRMICFLREGAMGCRIALDQSAQGVVGSEAKRHLQRAIMRDLLLLKRHKISSAELVYISFE